MALCHCRSGRRAPVSGPRRYPGDSAVTSVRRPSSIGWRRDRGAPGNRSCARHRLSPPSLTNAASPTWPISAAASARSPARHLPPGALRSAPFTLIADGHSLGTHASPGPPPVRSCSEPAPLWRCSRYPSLVRRCRCPSGSRINWSRSAAHTTRVAATSVTSIEPAGRPIGLR